MQGPLAQFGRAPQWHCGGHRFDPGTVHQIQGQSQYRLSFFFKENSTMIPQKISQDSKDNLIITWQDGHESKISLQTLRNGCPCASCQGETILMKQYAPVPQPDQPGKYVIRNAEQIGSYALQFSWGNGHSTGLYTWAHLRSLCECNECKG